MNKERCKLYKEKNKRKSVDRQSVLLEEYSLFKEKRRKIVEKSAEDSLQVNIQVSSEQNIFDKYKNILSEFEKKKTPNVNALGHNDDKIRCNNMSDCTEDNSFPSQLEQWFSEYKYNNNKLGEEISRWIVQNNIPQEPSNKLLKILNDRIQINMPKTTKTLLNSNIKFDIRPMQVSKESFGEYYYFGLENKLKKQINIDLHQSDVLEIIIHIDGISPFKSSSLVIWPILCKLYAKEGCYEPFTVAVFAGNGKPHSVTDYLSDFVSDVNKLQKSGIRIEDKLFQLRIKYFICDSPARSFVKCIVGHCAFAACERCKVRGVKVDKVTVFLDTHANKIIDAGFRTFEDPECHTGPSILTTIQLPINIVQQFILDPMHLLYLGCTKRFLEYLLKADVRHKCKLSPSLKNELSRRTQIINKNIPEEFPRKMRSTKDFAQWKAVEFKFFALYAAPIVLKNLVSDEIYNSFMLFSTACRLMTYEDPLPHLPITRRYFKQFVDTSADTYGSSFLSLNVHNLVHLCDDVEITKCNFNELSAFCFESYLGSISNMLRSPTHIVSQFCRRVLEKENFPTIAPNKSSSKIEILIKGKEKIRKLKYHDMILATSPPNNTIIIKDSSVALISEFFSDTSGIKVKVYKYLRKDSLFKLPCDSAFLKIWEVDYLSTSSTIIQLEKVVHKCINFEMNFSPEDATKNVVVPLLH